MRNHLVSVAIGVLLGGVGLLLWLTTGDVETPVIGLSQLGFVLLVIGGVEILVSGAALASPSMRRKEHDR